MKTQTIVTVGPLHPGLLLGSELSLDVTQKEKRQTPAAAALINEAVDKSRCLQCFQPARDYIKHTRQWMRRHTHTTSALGRLRQEDVKFQISPDSQNSKQTMCWRWYVSCRQDTVLHGALKTQTLGPKWS